jgi:hypothetical protein
MIGGVTRLGIRSKRGEESDPAIQRRCDSGSLWLSLAPFVPSASLTAAPEIAHAAVLSVTVPLDEHVVAIVEGVCDGLVIGLLLPHADAKNQKQNDAATFERWNQGSRMDSRGAPLSLVVICFYQASLWVPHVAALNAGLPTAQVRSSEEPIGLW